MEGATVSLGDAMLLGQRNGYDNNMAWQNNPFLYLIFLALFGNGGFGGFGGGNAAANGALTRAELAAGLDNQDVKAGIRGIEQGICNGFYNNNTTMLNGFNGIEKGLAQLGFNQQQCCCEIKSAVHSEGEATRALITNNAMQDLRDRVVEKDQLLQSANFQLSQLAQTANIINSVRPTPIPAYTVTNPFCCPTTTTTPTT